MKKMRPQVKRILLLLQSGMAMMLCLALLVTCFLSKAWFAENLTVSAQGMDLSASRLPTITTVGYTDANGNYTTTDVDVIENVRISADGSDELSPGAAGKFTLTFDYSVTDFADYLLSIQFSFRNVNGDIQENPYLNTHFGFFLNYDETTGKYSGWLNGETAPQPQAAEEVTVYWIWYSTVDDLLRMTDETVQEVYKKDPSKWLDGYTGTTLDFVNDKATIQLAYDAADTEIGSAFATTKLIFHFDIGIAEGGV